MMNEVACDERPCYLAHTDEIANTLGPRYPLILLFFALSKGSIRDNKVHIAKEALLQFHEMMIVTMVRSQSCSCQHARKGPIKTHLV